MHKVLVVDDSKMVRKILKKNFLTVDIDEENFFEAEDGNEAIEMMMLAEDVSLIVTDINMPGMDGPDFVKMVRKNPEYASSKIVVLSSVANDENIEKFHGYHIDSFLNKPFTQESFENVIVPLLFTSEISKTLEKMFEKKILEMDTTLNKVVFDKDFINSCLDECEGVNLDFEHLLNVIASKKLRLKAKDKIFLKDDELVVEKYVDLERERKRRIKEIREKISKFEKENSLIESSIYEIYSQNINFSEISNFSYEKHHHSIIKKGFSALFMRRFSLSEIEADIYISYLFEKKKREIDFAIADFMVINLGRNNKGIIKFLNYYTGGAKIIDGKRYKIASICDKDGVRLLIKDLAAVAKRASSIKRDIYNSKTKLREHREELHSLADTLEDSTKHFAENEKTFTPEEKKEKESIIDGLEKELFSIEKSEEEEKNSLNTLIKRFDDLKPQFEEVKESIVNTLSVKTEALNVGKLQEDAESKKEEEQVESSESVNVIKELLTTEQFVEKLLDDPKLFFDEVLENSEEFIKTISLDLITNSKLRAVLNFSFLTDYKNFEPKKIIPLLGKELSEIFSKYIHEKYKDDERVLEETFKNESRLEKRFLKIATYIGKEKSKLLGELFATNFIECADGLKQEHVKAMKFKAPILESAIVGVEHNPSLVKDGNTVIINKLSPLWIRVKQAGKKRKENLTKVKKLYHSVKPKFDQATKELQLLQKANSIKLSNVQKWNFEKLQNIIDENPTQKELLMNLPKGEVTAHFIALCEKQSRNSNPMEAGEGKRILEIFHKIEEVNTTTEVDKKMSTLRIEHGKLEINLKEKKTIFDKELSKGLAEYDRDLSKIYTIMVKNIAERF